MVSHPVNGRVVSILPSGVCGSPAAAFIFFIWTSQDRNACRRLHIGRSDHERRFRSNVNAIRSRVQCFDYHEGASRLIYALRDRAFSRFYRHAHLLGRATCVGSFVAWWLRAIYHDSSYTAGHKTATRMPHLIQLVIQAYLSAPLRAVNYSHRLMSKRLEAQIPRPERIPSPLKAASPAASVK